jgi:hypothetical protein
MISVENDSLQLSAVKLEPNEPEPVKPVLNLKEHEKGLAFFKNRQIDAENREIQEKYDHDMAEYQTAYTEYQNKNAGVNSFNKNSERTANEFNGMRKLVAEELLHPQKTAVRNDVENQVEAGKNSVEKQAEESKLTKAVLKSRDMHSK